MKKILLITCILIGLNSFAQDNFFWSYSNTKELYDTITLKNRFQSQSSLDGTFTTYSGDSLIFIDSNGSKKKLPSGISTSTFPLFITNANNAYLITKRNDLKSIVTQLFSSSLNFYNISKCKRLQAFDSQSNTEITSNIFTNNKILEYLKFRESFVALVDALDISNNNLLKEIYILNTPISSIILPSSIDLYDIFLYSNQSLASITFGNLNPNISRFNAYNCSFDQINIDKILKYFVDSNRSPFDLGTSPNDGIDLCGIRNGYPSSTGYEYVSILTSRGWSVCVNNNSTTPIVSTNDPTMVSSTSATLGGNASSDGGAGITARGVAYGTSINPTISGSHTTLGTGTGLFSSSVIGLSSSTLYHVRAYATNANGTSYGTDKTFTTTNAIQTVPELITTAPTAITTTTATSGGIITFDGNYEIIEKGICWSTSPTPTYSSSKTNDGSGPASFTSSITGLSPNTTYYLRAYATNRRDAGGSYVYATGYGQEEVFMTASSSECNLPTVTTNAVNSITTNSAIGGGNITSDGNCEVTIKGVCWSTAMNPTTSNLHTTDGSGIGAFSSSITGLTCGTTYYVRAYATNSSGTAYGNQVSFIPIQTPLITANLTGLTANPSYPVSIGGYWTVTLSNPAPSTVIIPISITSGDNTGTVNYNIQILAGNTTGEISVNYYFKTTDWTAYATFRTMPCGYSSGTTANILIPAYYSPVVGDSYGGGVVAYIFQSGDPGYVPGQTHGIIASTSDQSTGIQWYNGSFVVTDATSEGDLGGGLANTNKIVTVQGSGYYAAKLCYDLTLNGYSDWVLPNMGELRVLYNNKSLIGGFSTYNYWSSYEGTYMYAGLKSFGNGDEQTANKMADFVSVRAIRYF